MKIIRTSANALGHRNSCVPLSLSSATGISYEEVNRWLLYNGYRRNNTSGTRCGKFANYWNKTSFQIFGHDFTLTPKILNTGAKMAAVVPTLDRNLTYIVQTPSHWICVKNGIVYDSAPNTGMRKVICVWVLEGKFAAEPAPVLVPTPVPAGAPATPAKKKSMTFSEKEKAGLAARVMVTFTDRIDMEVYKLAAAKAKAQGISLNTMLRNMLIKEIVRK